MIPLWRAPDWGPTFVGAAVAAAVLALLAFLLRRGGPLADDGADAPQRKRQTRAVPLSGGPALCAAALVLSLGGFGHVVPWTLVDPLFAFDERALAVALALAFATGLADDLRARGLSPGWKLAGQTLAGVALAIGARDAAQSPTVVVAALVVLLAVAAQNVANTFDHTDGTLGAVALGGCAAAGSSFVGALAAFLGFNLARPRGGGPPYAYLGDSGSHFLGILLATTAAGHAALTLPAVDLARVVVLRMRAGQPVWRGDRRHVGTRIADSGRGPLEVVALVALCAAPAFAALPLSSGADPWPRYATLLLGAVGCAVVLAIVLRLHPEDAEPEAGGAGSGGDPCRSPDATR